jgi:hypothetical protein
MENLLIMKKCPRFESCSIPRCPLDKDWKEREELAEDERCLYFRVLGFRKTPKMFKGIISHQMRELVTATLQKRQSSPKTA